MWGRREPVSKQSTELKALHVGCNHETANRERSRSRHRSPTTISTSTLPLDRSIGGSWPVLLLLVVGVPAVSTPASGHCPLVLPAGAGQAAEGVEAIKSRSRRRGA